MSSEQSRTLYVIPKLSVSVKASLSSPLHCLEILPTSTDSSGVMIWGWGRSQRAVQVIFFCQWNSDMKKHLLLGYFGHLKLYIPRTRVGTPGPNYLQGHITITIRDLKPKIRYTMGDYHQSFLLEPSIAYHMLHMSIVHCRWVSEGFQLIRRPYK